MQVNGLASPRLAWPARLSGVKWCVVCDSVKGKEEGKEEEGDTHRERYTFLSES